MIERNISSSRIDKITAIIHIADVHIRNFKRHDEYQLVFDRLYETCKNIVKTEKNTVIYLAGDIVHAKTNLSPELVEMTRNFFVSLIEIAPVVLITGNHDASLNVHNRMDALSPIVNSIEYDDFHYLKDTGVYHFMNVDFVVNSVYDDPENFILAKDVAGDNTKIVLYHGTIDRAKTDIGIDMKNSRVPIEKFDGFDYGMFGDIHRFQYLDSKGKFAYAGSLVQQNFGEGLRHGILVWNIQTGKSKFVQIANDWEYHTLDIREGVFDSLPGSFAPKNRIRLRSHDTSHADLTKAVAQLKSIVKVDDLRIQKISTKGTTNNAAPIISIGDLRDAEYQNELICGYLEEKLSVVDDDLLDEVRKINRKINTSVGQSTAMRNIIWTPMRFEFDNMFSYGEGNFINFGSMTGTYGVFAENASGKSSILDALMFCIFDKCSKTFKASQVLNMKKDAFRCKLHFQIADTDYFIERIGIKDKKGHVKVTVNFWYEKDGNVVSLNGDDRDNTNYAIRDYLGTYEDFIITAVSLQNNNTNFIDTAQRDRKDLLAQFLDLDVFEELNAVALDESKTVLGMIKHINRQDHATSLADSHSKNNAAKLELADAMILKEKYQDEAEIQTAAILDLAKQLKQLDITVPSLSLQELQMQEAELEYNLNLNEGDLFMLEKGYALFSKEYQQLEDAFKKIDYAELKQRSQRLAEYEKKLQVCKSEIRSIELSISHNKSKIDKLSTHEYDPDCKYCVTNQFVIDAKNAESELAILMTDLKQQQDYSNTLQLEIDALSTVTDELKKYEESERELRISQKRVHEHETNIALNKSKHPLLEMQYKQVQDTILKYESNATVIEHNEAIQSQIADMEIVRDGIIQNLRDTESRIVVISGNIQLYTKIIEDCIAAIDQLRELELEYNAYSFYLKAVNRNGVPYNMISNALPKIQIEVNSILSQIVDFEVIFETDGKSINTYIVYDTDTFWPLETASGMEKFVSSLAIRTALINVSSLPRPNFVGIDEGLGALDASVMGNFSAFLEYMKTEFDFIILISHIDIVKDIVDSQIEISKEHGISSIQF